jgi:hypothetical protein
MRLRVPLEWYERIMAYYLSDDGMSEFERIGYGLRKEMERLRELYLGSHISEVEFEKEVLRVGKELERLQLSSHPQSKQIVTLLDNQGLSCNEWISFAHSRLLGL